MKTMSSTLDHVSKEGENVMLSGLEQVVDGSFSKWSRGGKDGLADT